MIAKPRIKVVVFDFDGVLVDSNQLKYDAFFKIFPPGERAEQIVENTLRDHREKTRLFIIERILTTLQEKENRKGGNLEIAVRSYAKKYNAIVEEGVINLGVTQGTLETLNNLHKKFPFYVNSTTPAPPLKRIIVKLSISKYFKNVYGGEKTKTENLADIMRNEKVLGNEIVVVGDGMSDLESAQNHGCRFIGVCNDFNRFDSNAFGNIDDLQSLARVIENL